MTIIDLKDRRLRYDYPGIEEKPIQIYFISIMFHSRICYFKNIIDDTKINVVFGNDGATHYLRQEEAQDVVDRLQNIAKEYNCSIEFFVASYWDYSGNI